MNSTPLYQDLDFPLDTSTNGPWNLQPNLDQFGSQDMEQHTFQSCQLHPQPMQRFIDDTERILFTATHQGVYQQEIQSFIQTSIPVSAVPYANNARMVSPAPSQGINSICSSAYSPKSENEEKYHQDMSFYSPQSQAYSFSTTVMDPSANSFPEYWSEQQLQWSAGGHVNMSQVQPMSDLHFPDTRDFELAEEGLFDSSHAREIKAEQEIGQRMNNQCYQADVSTIVVSTNQYNGGWQDDEGLGDSIKESESPVDSSIIHEQSCDLDAEGEVDDEHPDTRAITPLSPEYDSASPAPLILDEEDDDDEDYSPARSTQSRKRTASRSYPRGAVMPAKRTRHAKPLPKSRLPKAIQSRPFSSGDIRCTHTSCSRSDFKDEAALTRHIKSAHLRPYVCVFAFAGCTSDFASKNEWKRHVGTQHLGLHTWICTQGTCAKVIRSVASSTTTSSDTSNRGAEFNRKDLFTQHLKRMHAPVGVKPGKPSQKISQREWDDEIKKLQDSSKIMKRLPPKELRCCVDTCAGRFDGSNAWDDMMEHVAKHLEASANATLDGEDSEAVDMGNDELLVEWAIDVGILTRQGGNDRVRFAAEGEVREAKVKREG